MVVRTRHESVPATHRIRCLGSHPGVRYPRHDTTLTPWDCHIYADRARGVVLGGHWMYVSDVNMPYMECLGDMMRNPAKNTSTGHVLDVLSYSLPVPAGWSNCRSCPEFPRPTLPAGPSCWLTTWFRTFQPEMAPRAGPKQLTRAGWDSLGHVQETVGGHQKHGAGASLRKEGITKGLLRKPLGTSEGSLATNLGLKKLRTRLAAACPDTLEPSFFHVPPSGIS